ncbi:hypothetical protein LSCM1_04184 [Leishmania martiniquensis]|uniref:Uncharacterized protein n=1 Tax=Leishmania martiniquensis TaxID=1580590 RepID=A0A836GZ59_9TRYP|nr:hypothetical protein LSCM1_04184 [Leishmania martiniquensis]
MSHYDKIIEEDKLYLEKVGMHSILRQFAIDAMESRPANIYEYMMTWATRRRMSSTGFPKVTDDKCEVGGYPAEKEGAAAKAQADERPAASADETHRFSSNKSSPRRSGVEACQCH